MRRLETLGYALALASGTVLAQPAGPLGPFGQLDADQSGSLDYAEFAQGLRQADPLGGLDRNADAHLDAAEFAGPGPDSFDRWDTDGDRYLDEHEYGSGLFDAWDTDADGWLTESEWNEKSESDYP